MPRINIQVRNLDKVKAFLSVIPKEARAVGLKAVGLWLVGDNTRGLMAPPPQDYVPRAWAGYTTSPAQIRFFFATGIWVSDGQGGVIVNRYTRTNDMVNSFQFQSDENTFRITNNAPGIQWVMGDQQARQPLLVGWMKATTQILKMMPGALRYGQQQVNEWLKGQRM